MSRLKALFSPVLFQGRRKKRSYFEGWYFKIVNAAETRAYAFIPGIAINETGNRQSFIQVLDGRKRISEYHKFDFEAFYAAPDAFNIAIQQNRFSDDSISFNLPALKGTLHFKNRTPWPSRWYSPGIMGPFTFVPFMECYHGVVSMNHVVSGKLHIGNEVINFSNGRGYTEKDWGRSFPSAYVWMQSNHFSSPDISCMISIARIPWLGKSFTGFIGGIRFKNQLLRFSTYTMSKLLKLEISSESVELILENKDHRLEIHVHRDTSTSLASPVHGFMDGRIKESMSSRMAVLLIHRNTGQPILRDSGRNTALEVAGKVETIIRR